MDAWKINWPHTEGGEVMLDVEERGEDVPAGFVILVHPQTPAENMNCATISCWLNEAWSRFLTSPSKGSVAGCIRAVKIDKGAYTHLNSLNDHQDLW